ncbi:MAG: PAS domain S-box protein [Anaerolineae bacterium]
MSTPMNFTDLEHALFENAGDAIALSDAAGIVTEANPAYCRLYGYRREEIIQHSFAIIFPEAVRAAAVADYLRVFHQPEIAPAFQSMVQRGDGSERIVESVYSFIERDGQRVAMLSVIRDITDRVRMEKELRQARDELESQVRERTAKLTALNADLEAEINERKQIEERLRESQTYTRDLIDSSRDMIIAVNLDLCIVEFNRAAGKVFGYRHAEVLGKSSGMLYADSFEGEEVRRQTFQPQHFLGEVLNKRKNGEVFPALLSTSVIRNAAGEVIGTMGISREITQQKQLEEQARRADRLAALGRMAATLAHELNNPLQSIRATVELLLDFAPTEAERREGMEIIRNEIIRLGEISRRILDFARPTPVQPRQKVAVNALVEQTLTLARKQLQHAGIRITTHFQALPPVNAAPEQLTQVFLNLMLNAVEATGEGGVLEIATAREPGGVAITFTDDGPSIPPDLLPRLFEPFVTTKTQGSGLGLYISQSIIQQHGGSLTVANQGPARGVTFTIRLPALDRNQEIER